MSVRRLGAPHPAHVREDGGRPLSVAEQSVDAIAEEWVVEDRWWTGRPLRRRYFELILAGGRNVVVYRDLRGGEWFEQRS
jgi:hypothetical protein